MKRPKENPVPGLIASARLEAAAGYLSAAELGACLGVTRRTVQRWMSEEMHPPEVVKHILSCPRCRQHFFADAVMIRGG